MKKYSIIAFIILFGMSKYLYAQAETEALLQREHLLWISPNIASSNASALSSLYCEFPEFRGLSDAGLVFNYDFGTLGNPRTAERTRDMMFSTQSIRRFNNTFVSADFSYRVQRLSNVQWLNLMSQTPRPNAISDSTPGDFSSEGLFTTVNVGHRLNNNHTIGISLNYSIATGAKNVDLRNINRYLQFGIGPSWMFRQEWGGFGIDAGFHRAIEDMQYEQRVTQDAQFLFRMEGLWFFEQQTFSSTTGRFIQDAGYHANLTLDLNLGQMTLFNQFGVRYTDGFIKLRSTITQERFGEQEILNYTYRGTLIINPRNQIRVTAQNSTLRAYSLVQRNEINPYTLLQEFVTYARVPQSSEVRNTANITFAHASLRNGNAIDHAWRLEVGVGYNQRRITQRRFPLLYQQTITIYEGFASFNKNIQTQRFVFDIKPSVAISTGHGTMFERINLTGTEDLPEETLVFLPQLEHEFNYLRSTKLGVGLDATIARPIRGNWHRSLFLTARANYRHALSTDLSGLSRMYVSFHLGLNF